MVIRSPWMLTTPRCAARFALALAACGGSRVPPPTPAAAVAPSTSKPALGPDEHEPELYPPPWKTVGVGQTISFATSVIDQDLDVTAVALAKHPASATFDPITQTVTWTPTAADQPAATFTIAIAQPAPRQDARAHVLDRGRRDATAGTDRAGPEPDDRDAAADPTARAPRAGEP